MATPSDRIGPLFISECECCERPRPTKVYLDEDDNAVALCAYCVEQLTDQTYG